MLESEQTNLYSQPSCQRLSMSLYKSSLTKRCSTLSMNMDYLLSSFVSTQMGLTDVSQSIFQKEHFQKQAGPTHPPGKAHQGAVLSAGLLVQHLGSLRVILPIRRLLKVEMIHPLACFAILPKRSPLKSPSSPVFKQAKKCSLQVAEVKPIARPKPS